MAVARLVNGNHHLRNYKKIINLILGKGNALKKDFFLFFFLENFVLCKREMRPVESVEWTDWNDDKRIKEAILKRTFKR